MADEVLSSVPDGIATVTLNRPDKRNAMNTALLAALRTAFDALAGGCELALHCDLRVVADVARFGMPLARIGLVVPFPLGQKLVEVIGPAYTCELLFTAQPIDARRAYEIGMVHHVAPQAQLEEATYTLARSIAANAPLSLQGMKATVQRALAPREGIRHDDLDALALRARKSADAGEGRRAMLEKRRPVFRGE